MTRQGPTPGPVETLARLGLQSDYYRDDPDFREAVDNVLGNPSYDAAPDLLEALKAALPLLEGFDDAEWLSDEDDPVIAPVLKQIRAAIAKARP